VNKEVRMRKTTGRHVFLLSAILTLLGPVMMNGTQRKTATQLLRKRAWDMLWAGAHSSDTGKRSAAMQALGLLRPSLAVVRLAEGGLQDKEAGVRRAAATALGEMHSSSSIPDLNKALSDSDLTVSLAAARSLLLLKQKTGYSAYYAVLTGKRKSGQSLISQQLNQFDTPQKMAEFVFDQGIGFLPYAGYAIQVMQALKQKNNSPVRAAAATILENDPDPRSGQALAKACSDKDWIVRVAALQSVARRGDPALLSDIEAAMHDNNNTVQYTAAAAVFRLATVESTRGKNRARKSAAKAALG
jgi:HEAT repeat protein